MSASHPFWTLTRTSAFDPLRTLGLCPYELRSEGQLRDGTMGEDQRQTIGRRVPGIFKFLGLLSFGLGLWLFYPLPQTHADFMNSAKGLVTLWLATAIVFALYLNGRVGYTSDGFYIRGFGWRPLLGLGKEHYVAFDDIEKITPECARGGGGQMDWLMFGFLQLHTTSPRSDEQELCLYQIFFNREQLVTALQTVAETRPGIIDQEIIDALAAAA